MTLVIDNRDHLAAPDRLEFLPPTVLRQPRPPVLRLVWPVKEESEERDDFHLAQAQQLVDRHASSPAAWARLAQAEMVAGNADAAVAAARASLKQMTTPDGGPALAAAMVLVACDRAEDAERALQGFEPADGPLLTFRAALAAGRDDFESALRLISKEKSAEAASLRAWIRLEQRNYPEAIRWYREALRTGGPNPAVLNNLGYAHAALGQRERAIRGTKQALSLNPSQRSRVGLNLFAYYVSDGELRAAQTLLRSLQEEAPHDIELWFAEAHLLLSLGQPEDARRVLRRARTSLWAHLSEAHQAELIANQAFVDWRLGRATKASAVEEIITALESIDYASVRVAEMLPALLDRFSDLALLKKVLARMHKAHADDPLFGLETYAALLDRRYEGATKISLDWVESDPLDPYPAIAATYLLTDAMGDPEQAIEVGLPASRRMPGVNALRNNVAYALALTGRLSEARRVLPDDGSPQATATQALITLRSGDGETAFDVYRRAFEKALRSNNPDLPALVVIHAEMAVHCFGEKLSRENLGFPEIQAADDWADQPRFEIAFGMLTRVGIESSNVQAPALQ